MFTRTWRGSVSSVGPDRPGSEDQRPVTEASLGELPSEEYIQSRSGAYTWYNPPRGMRF